MSQCPFVVVFVCFCHRPGPGTGRLLAWKCISKNAFFWSNKCLIETYKLFWGKYIGSPEQKCVVAEQPTVHSEWASSIGFSDSIYTHTEIQILLQAGLFLSITFQEKEETICSIFSYMQKVQAHSWFTLVMNTLIASMKNGFQVTISKSEVRMTSNLFSLV